MGHEADQKSKIANSDTERAEREAAVPLPLFQPQLTASLHRPEPLGQVKGAKEDFDAKKLLPLSSWKAVWSLEASQRRGSAARFCMSSLLGWCAKDAREEVCACC